MLSSKKNLYRMPGSKDDAINHMRDHPGSCPGDELYLYVDTGKSHISYFYPGAACVEIKIGPVTIDCNVDDLTDITLNDLCDYWNL